MSILIAPSSARTLGDLKTRIADELARADLASQIALAIADAISEACTHRFWFMEVRGLTLPIVGGTQAYVGEDITQLIEIDRLVLMVGTQRRTLREMSDDQLDRWNDGTAPSGEPYAYSRYGDQLRFHPTPALSYTVLIDGLTRGAVLDADADTSIWTTTGERYIRALAKRNVLAEVMHDSERAQVMDALAVRYRDEFWAQTHSRTASNQMAYCA